MGLHGDSNQSWTYLSNGALQNTKSGMCLNVAGDTSTDGTPLITWPCSTDANDIWTLPTS